MRDGSRPRHGHARVNKTSPEYVSWENMIARCFQKNSPMYKKYGAKGVTVYPAWRKFGPFFAYMGPKPTPRHTIDRFPKRNGNYVPKEQSSNRDASVRLRLDGTERTLQEWASLRGMKGCTLYSRIRRGWAVRRAVMTPAAERSR